MKTLLNGLNKKNPLTKGFLQHAYINENSTTLDSIRLFQHFFKIQNCVIIQTSVN